MNENSSADQCDRFEEKQKRLEERRALRGGSGWIGGTTLVLLGILLLGQNMRLLNFENWWALFILLPAFGSFGTAWRIAQAAEGHFTSRARGAAIVGLMFCLLAAMFLFSLNWAIFGPALLVLGGVALLANGILPE